MLCSITACCAPQKMLSRQFICKKSAFYVKHVLTCSSSTTKNEKMNAAFIKRRFFNAKIPSQLDLDSISGGFIKRVLPYKQLARQIKSKKT